MLDNGKEAMPEAGARGEVHLVSDDGTTFLGYVGRSPGAARSRVVILPDVRGLHPAYRELTDRFAEAGCDAIAIDYFGRSAGVGWREDGFDYMPHVEQTTFAGQSADLRAAIEHLRSGERELSTYIIGFSLGGRLAFVSASLDLGIDGVIGFYGRPVGPAKNDIPEPVGLTDAITGRVLAVFGAADEGIPESHIAAFAAALERSAVDHRIVVYPSAPHSFFDRRASEFPEAADAAWREVIDFVGR